MPLRILLAVLVALACPTSQAWATGPQFGPMSGGGGGSGDVETVGDCTGPACFEGTTGNALQFEGATANGFETTLTATDPTADRTITLPNATGTVALERVYDVRAYGASCDGLIGSATANTTAIQAAIDAAEAGDGGIVQFPEGVCILNGALDLDDYEMITLQGVGGRSTSTRGSMLDFRVAGSGSLISAKRMTGLVLRDIGIRTNEATFTGTLIDYSGTVAVDDATFLVIDGAYILDLAGGVRSTTLLNLDRAHTIQIRDSRFDFGAYAIVGMQSGTYSNVVSITGTYFASQDVAPIWNPGDSWVIQGNTFQQRADGESVGIGHDSGVVGRGQLIAGNIFNDSTTGTASWITTASSGVQITGNLFAGTAGTEVGVTIDATTFSGAIEDNTFAVLGTGIDCTTGTAAQRIGQNTFTTVTTSVNSDCDGGTTGTVETTGQYVLNTTNNAYFNIDSDNNSASNSGFVFAHNGVGTSGGTKLLELNTNGDASFYAGLDPRLYETDNTNYVQLSAPTLGGNWTLTLPDTDGTSGQFLQTDGSGVTTWATPSGSGNVSNTGTPVDNQLAIWTDATTIEGDAALTFDTSTNTLTTTTFSGALSGNATTATTAGAGDSATSFFSSGELERTLLPAASADCSSSNWAKGIDADLVLDCSQPAFSDLSGSATDAQIPNNITVDLATLATTATTANAGDSATSFFSSGELERTLLPAASGDCSSNQFAKGVDADFVLDCAQPDHGGLAGLSDDDHTQYLALAGRTLSDPGGGVTTIATQTTSSPLAMTNASGFKWLNWDADLTVPNISLSQIFSVNGSLDRTGTSDSLYQFTGFHMATEFTSSTANGPLFQDAFYDASVVFQESGTATQNTYQPISFLSKPTYKAASGASLTIGQTTGVDINPSWGVAAGGTLTNTTFSAFKLHTPNEIGGTLSLPTYIALDVEDLDTAAVTTPLSLRSVGTTTEMRHAGPARFGATGAPTASFDLDVQGDTFIGGKLDIGDDLADPGASTTTSVIDVQGTIGLPNNAGHLLGLNISPTVAQSESNNFVAIDFSPVVTQSGAIEVPTMYGINMAGTTTVTGATTFPTASVLRLNHTFTTATADADPVSSLVSLHTIPVLSVSAASGASGTAALTSVYHNPAVSIPSGGATYTLADDTAIDVFGGYTESAGTLIVTTRRGLRFRDVGVVGSPAITSNIGVDIAALSTATTNIGIRNADTTVYTPTTQAITANSDTIQPAATTVCLTANSNYDLTSNPQIADGVEGQILYLWNCDSAADTIEINDTNGLQLTALFNMDAGDVIVLQYMTIAGASDWYEVSRTED